MIKSKTRVGHIQPVFRYSDETEKKMRVQIARIAVLYDDLMLEYDGAQEATIATLDRSGVNSRRFYFVRRSLGTLMELKGAFVVLDGNDAFKASKKWWDKRDLSQWDNLSQWDTAVKFFQANQKFLKDWRNDIGGHFLDGAAEYAIDNVHPDTVGTIEIYRRGSGADIKMPFAYELVAVALVKNKNAKTPEEDFLKEAFTFLADATKHAINAVAVVVAHEMFDRFK